MRKKVYFWVTFSVLVTTVFSFFRVNSYCIILFGAVRLFDGNPFSNAKAAFSNKYVLAYLAYFLTDLLGQLHAHDLATGWNMVSKDATLIAVPFMLCSRPFADSESYKKLMATYCLIVAAASIWCIGRAAMNYSVDRDIEDFFFHSLVRPISQNAVFYTVFVLSGLLFLLSSDITGAIPRIGPAAAKRLRTGLILLFILMVVMLASKLFLILLVLILLYFLFKKYSFRKNRIALTGVGSALLVLVILVLFTNNPIKKRYSDLVEGDISMVEKEKFNQGVYFNDIQLRLVQWRFAYEILQEHHAWLLGVSAGDSQDLLNQKYTDADMYMGVPGTRNHGIHGYNFHNQFIETLVRSGIVGEIVLLTIFGLFIGIIRRWRTGLAFFTVLIMGLFFLLQSPLTMMHGVFLFSYFPMMLLYSPKARE